MTLEPPGYDCKLKELYEVEACGCSLSVCRDVYEPAEDTWMVAEGLAGEESLVCIDVGTGCGVLAACAARRCGYVVALDPNPCAAKCAYLNLEKCLKRMVADVVQCLGVDCLRPGGYLVIFNAPYLPEEPKDWVEAAWAGGYPVIESVLTLLARWRACWRLLITVASTTPLEAVERLAERLGLEAEKLRMVHEDFFTDVYLLRVTPRRCASRKQR